MSEGQARYRAIWTTLDGTLRGVSKGLKTLVRTLRWLRAFLVLAVLTVLASAVIAIAWPAGFPYFYAAASVFLVIPLIILLILVALPLQAKSIVRLIDIGYPENAKELAIRVVARKLHEQSIESEELLVETAFNESRKLLKRYRERAERVKQDLAEAEEAARAAQAAADRAARSASGDDHGS